MDDFRQFGFLLHFDVQRPHEIAGPADGAVQDVALVGTLVFFLDRDAHGDVAGARGATAAAASEQGCGGRRAHACRCGKGGRQRGVVGEVFADFFVFKPVLGDEVGEFLDALVDVVAAAALDHVVGLAPAASLGFLGLVAGLVVGAVDFGGQGGVFAGFEDFGDLGVVGVAR